MAFRSLPALGSEDGSTFSYNALMNKQVLREPVQTACDLLFLGNTER